MFGKKKRSPVALVTGVSIAALGAAAPGVAAAQEQARVSDEIVVTAQKREEALQDVPIAVSAFSQDALQALQISGGPNLVTAIPNSNFSKGNFGGYNFQIRGVGTKAVGVSVDGATGVHQNGAPLGANNLYEAEFYDVERVEVLRGPQGTLYGRNATGGVINIITAKPRTGEFSAYGNVTGGNYGTIRTEGMVNVPIGDAIALRVAGAMLQRDGYATNQITGHDVDDRDLYGVRATLGIDLSQDASLTLQYEHFDEDDARNRNGKQLCIKDPGDATIGGVAVTGLSRGFLSQGCADGNAISSRDTVNTAATLGGLLGNLTGLITGDAAAGQQVPRDLRTIQSAFDPIYRANTDYYQLNFSWDFTDNLSLTWLASHSDYEYASSEDYNKFRTNGLFNPIPVLFPTGVVNDPQVGPSNTLRTQDVSSGTNEYTSNEIRIQSDYDGPLNFNVGGIYINTSANGRYYVFGNTLTAFAILTNATSGPAGQIPIDTSNPTGATILQRFNDSGRNYFLSNSDYDLKASAVFGELYYEMSDTFKVTLGLRQTNDEKRQSNRFSTLLTNVGALPLAATAPTHAYFTDPATPYLFASFEEITGRFGFDWKPDLSFTDDTLLYAFYSKGYKGGGINPPSAVGVTSIKPTFEPEFVNAIEIGTKNTMADGRLMLNLTGFNYDYKGYQVSKIVNRSSLNENIDVQSYGLELESRWSPIDPLTFILNAGYLHTDIQSGRSIDNLNRTQGNALQTVIKASDASNCVGNVRGVAAVQAAINSAIPGFGPTALLGYCSGAFAGLSAPTIALLNGNLQAVSPGATLTAADLTPSEGTEANLAGKQLPNAPEFTVSLGAQWVQPIGGDWSLTFRGDYYHQDASFARVYNTAADQLPSWENANFSIALGNDAHGLEIKAFVKNAFDDDSITDMYLTDDSSGLFRNYFLVEPQTYGITVQKRW